MFETLTAPELDKILRLMAMFRDDPRRDKVDLGVGVYRTPNGRTPVLRAVKAAEQQIWNTQDTKSYVALAGDAAFHGAMRQLILGNSVPATRVAALATPGGTGAVRQVLEMTRKLTPDATIWISTPTWPNHPSIIEYLGLTAREYRYYDPDTGGLDRVGMLADLEQAQAGDLILLHACCHNPTGADLTVQDWQDLADLFVKTGAIPFVDMAYLGFGNGIEADAVGTRMLAAQLPEVLIAASCSKNFGLYRDRVGIVLAVCGTPAAQIAASGYLAYLNRQNYAFPPDHGARVVETILNDLTLAADWRVELAEMRDGMNASRAAFAAALRTETGSDRFGFLASHLGMFSLIGADPGQVTRLRDEFGIYLVGDGRMNIAGLTPQTIPVVARAVAAVLG
jgi:aspartate/tyrosine/aromatic aminotransferase